MNVFCEEGEEVLYHVGE